LANFYLDVTTVGMVKTKVTQIETK